MTNKGLSPVQSNSIKLELNMTLFKQVEVMLDNKAVKVECMSYHCVFDLNGVAAESSHSLQVRLIEDSQVEWANHELLVLEYWPNQALDAHEDSPHIEKVKVQLDMTEGIEQIDDPDTETD